MSPVAHARACPVGTTLSIACEQGVHLAVAGRILYRRCISTGAQEGANGAELVTARLVERGPNRRAERSAVVHAPLLHRSAAREQ